MDEKYPLHAELSARLPEAQTISAFWDWLSENNLAICLRDTFGYVPDGRSPNQLIGDFMGICPDALDAEKRAMLEEIRAGRPE